MVSAAEQKDGHEKEATKIGNKLREQYNENKKERYQEEKSTYEGQI